MIIPFVLAALAQAQPKAGPYDAFVANRAATRANAEFVFTSGSVDYRELASGRLWESGDHGLVPVPVLTVIGRYECDGEAEHSVCQPSGEAAALIRKATKPGDKVPGMPAIEILWDGQTAAYHLLDENPFVLHVENRDDRGLLGYSPYHFLQERLEDLKSRLYRIREPRVVNTTKGGHPCKMEIYRNEHLDMWNQLEVCYDPAIGYLPRFIRYIVFEGNGTSKEQTIVSETYLSDAKICASGGFLPTEWTNVMFILKNFTTKYKNYDDSTVLEPESSQISAKRLKVTKFADRKAPVQLDQLEGLAGLSGIGGRILISQKPRTMTLREAKSRLGAKLTQRSGIVLPEIDQSELHEFDAVSGWNRRAWLIGGIGLLLAVVILFFYKRRKALLAIAFVTIALQALGCSGREPPQVHLLAAFDKTRVVYSSREPSLSLNIIFRNEGTCSIRVFNVSGGCSCRKVTETSLPKDLHPGHNLSLPVQLQNQGNFAEMSYSFHIESDRGPIDVAAKLFAIPDHAFSPNSIALTGMVEGEQRTFELVHREVFGEASVRSSASIRFPNLLPGTKISSRQGQVGGAPDLSFIETVYRVSVDDLSLGLHREAIELESTNERSSTSVPVVWERVSYLSSAPQRVVLGYVPVRVFLRCPDEEVEMVRVLKAPSGVKAVVSSTRELTVTLDPKAPPIIDGRIEVETTARDRKPLQVAVVRYSPKD